MTDEEKTLVRQICNKADDIEKRLNELARGTAELSDHLDRLSHNLFTIARYDSEYDQLIHDEIDKVEKEAAELIRKAEKEVKHG